MLEFLSSHSVEITAIITALGGAIGAIVSLIQVFKNNRKINKNNELTKQDIKITREGIVEAFKSAKIPNEWKISVSTQVNKMLVSFRDEFIKLYKENAEMSNKLLAISAKVLSFTAASDKLTADEKKQLQDLILLLNKEDYTIDISDDNK